MLFDDIFNSGEECVALVLSVLSPGYKHGSTSSQVRNIQWLLKERYPPKSLGDVNWTLSSNGDHLDRTQRSLLPSTSSTTFALVQRVDVGGGEAGAGQPELRGGLALAQLLLLLVLLNQVGLRAGHGQLRGEGGLPHRHPQQGGEQVHQGHLDGDQS